MMVQPSRDMVARKTLMRALRVWLGWAVGLTPYSFGSLPHGCLLSLKLSEIEPWCGLGGTSQRGAVASTDPHQPEIPGTREFSFKIKRWQVDKSGCCPILQSRVNVDWFTFDPQIFTPLFSRLYDGILYDVFIQKASVAWHNAPHGKSPSSRHYGSGRMALQSKGQQTHVAITDQPPTELFMRRERRRLQARHIWMEIKPKWPKIKERIRTKHATGLPCMTLYRRLFLNEFTEESRWLEDPYKGPNEDHITRQWESNQAWFTEQATACSPFRWLSTRCSGVAMGWLPRTHCCTGMAHQTGCLSTQVASRCEGWSHERPTISFCGSFKGTCSGGVLLCLESGIGCKEVAWTDGGLPSVPPVGDGCWIDVTLIQEGRLYLYVPLQDGKLQCLFRRKGGLSRLSVTPGWYWLSSQILCILVQECIK